MPALLSLRRSDDLCTFKRTSRVGVGFDLNRGVIDAELLLEAVGDFCREGVAGITIGDE